jgi:undecaprenyl-diphosphatase
MVKLFFFNRLIGFAVLILLFDVSVGSAQNAGIRLLRNINGERTSSLDGPMIALTNSVYPISAAIPVTELIAGYTRRDKKLLAYGLQTTAGFALNTILTFGMKYAVNRPRPYKTYTGIHNYQNDLDPSFPSGHSSFAFCSATSLCLVWPRWYVIAPSFAWAAAAGYSRLYLGMHYPGDVLAGAVSGAGSAFLSLLGNRYLQYRKYKRDFIL